MIRLLALSIGDSGHTTSIGNLPTSISNILNASNPIGSIIGLVINLLFFSVALLAFVFAMYSGYRMMVSKGDKKEIEEARLIFFNSIIGLVVVMAAFLFINTIGSFFNLHLFQVTLP